MTIAGDEPTTLTPFEGASLRLGMAADACDPDQFAALLPALAAQRIAIELTAERGEAGVGIWATPDRLTRAGDLLSSSGLGLNVTRCPTLAFAPPLVGWQLGTTLSDALPLTTLADSELDLPTVLLNLLAEREGVDAAFQVVIEPFSSPAWRDRALKLAAELTNPPRDLLDLAVAMLAGAPPRRSQRVARWLSALQQATYEKAFCPVLFRVAPRFVVSGPDGEEIRAAAMEALELVVGATVAGANRLTPVRVPGAAQLADAFNRRSPSGAVVLTAKEVCVLIRPPRRPRDVQSLARPVRVVASPTQARSGDIRLGRDGAGRPVYLHQGDRARGLLVVGATGTGKSTLMENLALADIAAGKGVGYFDPKADAVRAILGRFPRHRRGDLLMLSRDSDCLPDCNPLRAGPGVTPQRKADEVIVCLRRLYDSWGVRMERVLWQGLVAVQALPEATLADLYRFLVDPGFRRHVLGGVRDEFVLRFWEEEFESLSAGNKGEWLSPVLARLQPFLADPFVRKVLCESSGPDIHDIRERQLVLLADLSYGTLGEGASRVLSSLTLTSFHLDALATADRPEAERRDYYLYIDEAHATAPANFVAMLPQVRAFRLNTVLSTQFLHQFPPEVVQTLIGNVGAVIAFRLGEHDARLLAERFKPEFDLTDLVGLDNYTAAVRMAADGRMLRPFSLLTNPLPVPAAADAAFESTHSRGPAPSQAGPRATARRRELAATRPLDFEWETDGPALAASAPGKHTIQVQEGADGGTIGRGN